MYTRVFGRYFSSPTRDGPSENPLPAEKDTIRATGAIRNVCFFCRFKRRRRSRAFALVTMGSDQRVAREQNHNEIGGSDRMLSFAGCCRGGAQIFTLFRARAFDAESNVMGYGIQFEPELYFQMSLASSIPTGTWTVRFPQQIMEPMNGIGDASWK